MDKKKIQELKIKLEKEKSEIQEELSVFANKDKDMKGDWDTRFPKLEGPEGSTADLEMAADEVEEYINRLPVEYILEIRLKNITSALKKIKEGEYGTCEKCGKEISLKRLEIYPEAKYCLECK